MIEIPEKINLTAYYLDSNLEKGKADKVAVYYRDETLTYSQVAALTNQVGNVLRDLGVEAEDRVLLALNDSPEFIASWFGIIKIGAVATDVYSFLQPKDYAYFLNYTRAKVAIVDAATLNKFEQAAASSKHLKHVLVVGERASGESLSYHELVDKAPDKLQAEDTHADDIALWKFTSGTTGQPKGVALTHRNSIYNFLCYGRQILQYAEDDITLSVPKLFFGYARDAGVVFAFGSSAAAAIFPERSTAEKIFEMIEKHRPTVLINVPTMINAMLTTPGAKDRDLSSIRFSTSAGEALPAELYYRWKKTFGSEVLDFIGSAELYHGYLTNALDDVKPGSLGKPVPGYEAKIVDAQGHEVPDGEMGLLWVKGDSAGLMYWNAYEKSKRTFHGEWVNTGDLFRKDKEGYYWFAGRGEDVLKVGGIFVAPLEIENCLLGHPMVKECAVIGAPDEQGLIKPKAFIVLAEGHKKSDALAREIQDYVKNTLAPYKYPRRVEFIDELPKDDRGKVRKRALNEKPAA
jgi:benzoate-CoA ligase family protein